MASNEEEGLKQIFPQLVASLQVNDIIDHLYKKSLLTDSEYVGFAKDIAQKVHSRDVNRGILMAVKKGPKGSISKFEEILRMSQPDLARELRKAIRAPSRAQKPRMGKSVSESEISAKQTKMQSHHDDMAQPHSTVSAPNQPSQSKFDAAGLERFSTSQSNLSVEERLAEMERQLEKTVSCWKELSSLLRPQMEKPTSSTKKHDTESMESLPMELSSVTLSERRSHMWEQSLLPEDLSSKTQLEVFQTDPLLGKLNLHSEKLVEVPIGTGCATAVIIGKKVYVCGGRCDTIKLGRQVHVYCLKEKTWTTLSEPTPQFRCEAIAINNHLVLIGGHEASSEKITNMVSTLTGQGWQQDIPVMPTKRLRPGVIKYDKFIIAAGGMSEDNQILLSTIDILDTSTMQWWAPANFQLPMPMYALNIAVCSSGMYVVAAIIDWSVTSICKVPSNKAWHLPVGVLEEELTPKKEQNIVPQQYRWREIAATPYNHSTLLKSSTHPVAVGGAVGGDRSGCNSNPNISVYDPIRDKWSIVGELLEQRARCTVACVNSSGFLVCGGYSDTVNQPCISSVELLSYQILPAV